MLNKKILAGVASALVLGFCTPAIAEVKVALDTPKSMDAGNYVWANAFTNYLNANGMKATEFERGSLGNEAERLDQISQGLLEVSMSDIKSAGTLDGTVFGLYLPYFFEDHRQLVKALTKGGMLERINAQTIPKGVRVANFVFMGGSVGIFNTKKPISTLADIKGMRFRALNEVQLEIFKSWGAQGTIIAWEEVPNALHTGVADGYMNPSHIPLLYGHTGFIKHFTDAQVMPMTRAALISEDWYQSLSDKERATVNAAVEFANEINLKWLLTQDEHLTKLAEAGVTVTDLSETARAEFRKASQANWGNVSMPDGALDAWKAAIAD